MRAHYRIVSEKQLLSPQVTLLPKIYLSKAAISDVYKENRAIVLLTSPFALIKEKVVSFLQNIPFLNVNLFFSADSDYVMQRNIDDNESLNQPSKAVTSLSYVTEWLSTELKDTQKVIHAYSLSLNALPLFYSTYCRLLLILQVPTHEPIWSAFRILSLCCSVLIVVPTSRKLCDLHGYAFFSWCHCRKVDHFHPSVLACV